VPGSGSVPAADPDTVPAPDTDADTDTDTDTADTDTDTDTADTHPADPHASDPDTDSADTHATDSDTHPTDTHATDTHADPANSHATDSDTHPADTHATDSDTHPTDTDTADTHADPANSHATDTDTHPANSDTDPTDPDPADTHASDTDPADPHATDPDPADPHATDTDPADTDPADTDPADPDPADPHPADSDPADPHPADTRPDAADPDAGRPGDVSLSQHAPYSCSRPSHMADDLAAPGVGPFASWQDWLADRQPGAGQSRGVFVIGMHRSGTSATARALNLLGMPLARPPDLVISRGGNSRGYWESQSLIAHNERLLNSFGSAWWCPPPRAELLGRFDAAEPRTLAEARETFQSVHLSAQWAWKDPRLCLLLPFWRRALDIPAAAFLVFRHPAEVASSLQERNRLAPAWGLALWERYTRQALLGLTGSPVFAFRYTDLLSDPGGWCEKARSFIRRHGFADVIGGEEEITSFIAKQMRHQHVDSMQPHSLGAGQRSLFRRCEELVGVHESFEPEIDDLDSAPTVAELAAQRRRWERLRNKSGKDERKSTPMNETIPPGWRRWLARNAMLRLGDDDMTRIMASHDFSADLVGATLAELRADPCYQVGAEHTQKLQKIESVLEIKRGLLSLLPSAGQLERRREVRRGEFMARYYAKNTPVIMLDIADTWPARYNWTLDYLEQQLGDETVEIMTNRDSDPQYERNGERHRTQVKFWEYTSYLRENPTGNDRYLVANNGLLDLPGAKRLHDDFEAPAEYLDETISRGRVFLWLGAAGTVTPLHHDVMNILLVQVTGRKRIILIDPLQGGYLYNDHGVFSMVDAANPDYSRFPLYAHADPITVVLEPGDALFIPVGWWHHVESLDLSASLSFTNFVFPNEYDWRHPEPSAL
jgi:Cupin-like domain